MTFPQVLIVGAGVTGSVLAALLKDTGFSVRVLEKSRGAGGRMNTFRFRNGADRQAPPLARADLGAQYITTRSPPDHPILGPVYDDLLQSGVLATFSGEITGPNPYGDAGEEVRHFTAPQGLQSVAEHFLKKSEARVDWAAALEELSIDSDGRPRLRMAGSEACMEPATGHSVVVLTQPVPQILGHSKYPLNGNFLQHVDDSIAAKLRQAQYSSRFAAAFFFDSAFEWPYSWTARYFEGGDVRYVSHDSCKRNAVGESLLSVVVHSGVPLGIEFLDEEDPFEEASARLRADLEAKLPEVPWSAALGGKVQKWKYSQVYKSVGGTKPSPDWTWPADPEEAHKAAPGFVPLFQSATALGLLCGDAVAPASNFEGCVFSAHRAAAAIRAFLQESVRSDL